MAYMKYTQYVYLLIAVFFVYEGITKINDGNDIPYLYFIIAAMSIVMFFVRRRFARKYDNHNKKQ
ncbi:hypothetical protein [Flavobacterium hercynium]|uniref:Uncharacterized protein n=1 Tax=Flavobacterium hercynium TaxID=387094 RepID=A0A226HG74_9FLAO|nr:hypothetical protein [Flavobacterium hercynium]OXA92858.1 hypothetical protein B0A66_08785 [Flavobacterium hercynium]SMP02827.1 hypothetical protein SAMN06265346_101189 [Flavobacterium hercynium]